MAFVAEITPSFVDKPKDGLRETAIHTDKSGNKRKSRRKEKKFFLKISIKMLFERNE